MGTSSSHSGPGDGPGLLPSWATGNGDISVPAGDAADVDASDSASEDSQSNNAQQTPLTPVSAPTTPKYWQSAKSGMTRFARSGGGSAGLRPAGSGYVRAKGGARKAALSSTSGRAASSYIGGFLSSAVKSGVQQALGSVGLLDVVGQSTDYVLTRLVDALAPSGASKEEAAARRATVEVLEFLYETVIGENGELSALEQMDQETVEEAVTRSVSGYIYNRWLDELGLSIEKGAVSEAAAVRLEREVKEYVESCVGLELDSKKVIEINWGGREGRQIIDKVYRDAYALLEVGA